MSQDRDALDQVLRAALADHAAAGVPGRNPSIRRRVIDGMAVRRGGRRRARRIALALVAAAIALALATGVAFGTGLINQSIVQVPESVWLSHFAAQHHGATGKGSAQTNAEQPATVAEAQRQAGFHVYALAGMPGATLTNVISRTVTFRDGSTEPEVELDYQVGDFRVDVIEVKDPNPTAPMEIPPIRQANTQLETIDGAPYLVIGDAQGGVHVMQFKRADGVVFSVNFFGPRVAGGADFAGADRQLAIGVIRHLR